MPASGDRPPEPSRPPEVDPALGREPVESRPPRPGERTTFERRTAARAAAFKDRESRRRETFQAREHRRSDIYDSCDVARQTLTATAELYRSLGEAVARSFEAFNAELDPELVRTTGITRSTFEALAEGNAEFFDSLADSSRRTSDELRAEPDRTRERPPEAAIDHELLAKLIARELRKTEPQG